MIKKFIHLVGIGILVTNGVSVVNAATVSLEDSQQIHEKTSTVDTLIAGSDRYIIELGKSSTTSVLVNDFINGKKANTNNIIISNVVTENDNITMDRMKGIVNISPNTLPGIYVIKYTICSIANSDSCDFSDVHIEVISPTKEIVQDEIVSFCEPYIAPTMNRTQTTNSVTKVELKDQTASTVNNLRYGSGKGKHLLSYSFDGTTKRIERIATPRVKFYLRRNNDTSILAKDNLYIESLGTTNFALTYPYSTEDMFAEGYLNIGFDNVFTNAASDNLSNIERLDVIFVEGYTIVDPSNEMILVSERGGTVGSSSNLNETINIAVVKEINPITNEPTIIGNPISVDHQKMFWLNGGNSVSYEVISRITKSSDLPQNQFSRTNTSLNQPSGLAAITYKQLGIQPNEIVYGYVILPNDYNHTGATPLEYLRFPTNTQQNYGGHDISIINGVFSACQTYACYNGANIEDAAIPVNHGISLLNRNVEENDSWPMIRNSGFTVLESNHKGFVPTRMSKVDIEGDLSTPSKITNPQEGMMIFDTTEKCLKIYDGTKWSCFSEPACP